MKTVLETVVGDLDITGCPTTSAGRRILSAKITLVSGTGKRSGWSSTGSAHMIGYLPQVEILVHDKKGGRLCMWSMTFLADDFRIPGRGCSDDRDLEAWVIRNQEIADRLHECSEAALAAVNAGRVAVVPRDRIYDIAGRTMVTAGDDDDRR